jgi:hypothetical protein
MAGKAALKRPHSKRWREKHELLNREAFGVRAL